MTGERMERSKVEVKNLLRMRMDLAFLKRGKVEQYSALFRRQAAAIGITNVNRW